MNYQDKTKDELLKDLLDLQQKYAAMSLLNQTDKSVLGALVENNSDVMLIKDSDRKIIAANTAFLKATGYNSISELIGKTDAEILNIPENSEPVFSYMQEDLKALQLSAGETIEREENIPFHSGEIKTFLTKKFPIYIEKKIIGIGIITSDITRIKRTEQFLLKEKARTEKSEEKYRFLIDNINDLVCEIDENGIYTFVCANYKELLGYEPDELMGKNVVDLIHPEDISLSQKKHEKIKKTLEKSIDIWRFKHKNGEYRIIESKGAIYTNSENEKRTVVISRDITEQKLAELELIAAKEKAEESDRLKSAFLANMSHEIRTPMNGILGFAELLKKPFISGEKQQKYIEIIEKSGARMLNIINDIIDISKIEAGLMEVDFRRANINEQIQYIHSFFKPEAEAKGIKLMFKTPLTENKAVIKTDHEKLYSIIANLVKNAIKYTEEGEIELGYFLEKASNKSADKPIRLQFYVKDTGIGISKERQKAIFERFIQADISDKMARQGTGLGLSITKAYVEMLSGDIWLESEEGIGSTFYFTLPYRNETVESPLPEDDLFSDKTDNNIKKLKILIAEDDEVSGMLLDIQVKPFCKEIIKVSTGAEAVEACRNNPGIDLILMDIKMPGMNGYEATRQIRQFNEEVIIIAQTAYGLAGDKEKATDAGCNDYIAKPVKDNLLKNMIQKLIKK